VSEPVVPSINLSVLHQKDPTPSQPSGEEGAGPNLSSAGPVLTGEKEPEAVESEPSFPVEDPSLHLSLEEAIQLGAVDSAFFNSLWFPKTFRQEPALFHPEMDKLLDSPEQRYVNIQVCRDGAKTTKLRAYSAKRIAYGISRTILYIAVSETKAIQSVSWLKHQIETNKMFREAFGLSKGKPWTDVHICINHNNLERNEDGTPVITKIHVLAYGVTGGVRGTNIEDYRPDLIIVDDVMDDDNSATKEQRDKIKNRILGAIKESLSPRSETPDAKMVLLNTPQDFEDLSEDAKKDKQFVSASYGCWTKETEDLATEEQESSWPARYPSVELRAEKEAAIARNKYAIFAREKECKLVVAEDCAFRTEWLNFFGEGEKEPEPPKHEMWVVMAIDPVPPPTKLQLEKGFRDKDYESLAMVGKYNGNYYLLEQVHNRGHDPGWTVKVFFEMCIRWSPMFVVVETVAYKQMLAWLLRKAMQRMRRYWAIEEMDDKRDKYKRIVDGLHGPASEGKLFVRRSQTAFIGQFTHFPGKNPEGNFDDDLEAAAVAVGRLNKGFIANRGKSTDLKSEEEEFELLEYGGAP